MFKTCQPVMKNAWCNFKIPTKSNTNKMKVGGAASRFFTTEIW